LECPLAAREVRPQWVTVNLQELFGSLQELFGSPKKSPAYKPGQNEINEFSIQSISLFSPNATLN
jgi:hypothetical protein